MIWEIPADAVEWNIAKIRAPEAWAIGIQGQGIVVADEHQSVVERVVLRLAGLIREVDAEMEPAVGERGLLGIAFGELGLHRVYGRTEGRNEASAGLMRRLGMRQEAHFRENELFKGAWGDEP